MPKKHQGSVSLKHTFEQAHRWLSLNRSNDLVTNKGAHFQALAYTAGKGPHQGEKVIRLLKGNREIARAYECCWGHDTNCGKTRIGDYCAAIDAAMEKSP